MNTIQDANQDRASRLSAAILRISQTLDLATVLKEVVDSARALTGARQGVITTLDERRRVRDLVTSGLSSEEQRMMLQWPDGLRFFDHIQSLSAPLRVANVPGYLCDIGLSPNPWGGTTLQGAPMHQQTNQVCIFLCLLRLGVWRLRFPPIRSRLSGFQVRTLRRPSSACLRCPVLAC